MEAAWMQSCGTKEDCHGFGTWNMGLELFDELENFL